MRSDVYYNKPIVREVLVFEIIQQLIHKFDPCVINGERIDFRKRIKPDSFILCNALRESYGLDDDDIKVEYGYYRPAKNLRVPHAWLRCIHSNSIIDLQQPFTLGDPVYIDINSIQAACRGKAKILYIKDSGAYDAYMQENHQKYHDEIHIVIDEFNKLIKTLY